MTYHLTFSLQHKPNYNPTAPAPCALYHLA